MDSEFIDLEEKLSISNLFDDVINVLESLYALMFKNLSLLHFGAFLLLYHVVHFHIFNSFFFLVLLLQINGSLARKALQDLLERGLIRLVSGHATLSIYTRATNT